ncbi:MAG TPA: hypothetical protein VL172_06315 [Kofleriaceae bacterium]|jgi:hypothetical protein|nr:hypothetical protein [Kofleriaceae bacterium]
MRSSILLLSLPLALLGCKKDDRSGLPPASEWHQPSEQELRGGGQQAQDDQPEGEMPDDDIHAGMGSGDRGDLPPAEGEMPEDDIHGGGGGAMPPGHGGGEAMPPGHGAEGGGAADAPIDPSKFLEGTVTLSPAAKAAMKPGMVLYLSTKPAGTADCTAKGIIPNASRKVPDPSFPFAFKLTQADARTMGGNVLDGEYLLCAHLSHGDASGREPGDSFGGLKVKVPQKGIAITLDKVL